MLKVTSVRAFRDNYIWLIHSAVDPRRVAIVDPGDATPVLTAVADHAVTPSAILATHHHPDHVGGITEILRHYEVPVFGPAGETIPGITDPVGEGDIARIADMGLRFAVRDIPGHTLGHIAYHGHGAVFCGDTLFSAGCGRVFEGTASQMLRSLDVLAALPGPTKVYCGHEYTLANLKFALAVEPDNQAAQRFLEVAGKRRDRDRPTLPSAIALEHRINPFLRCRRSKVRAAAEARAGRALLDATEVFAVIREWKDGFQ